MTQKPEFPKALVVSGKKGAGKDTLAPLIAKHLADADPVHMSFAGPLKDQIDTIMNLCREHTSPDAAAVAISEWIGDAPDEVVSKLISILYDAVHADPLDHARSHSPAAVAALQYFGTQFRRAQDPDYWVKLAVANATQAIEKGQYPYFTDARFPNEVQALVDMGALAVRLELTPEEQARRLQGRDGRVPDAKELNHQSETALDGYTGFHIVIPCTDGVDKTLNMALALAA